MFATTTPPSPALLALWQPLHLVVPLIMALDLVASFLLGSLKQQRGGVAGNMGYNMALLGVPAADRDRNRQWSAAGRSD